MEPKPTEKHPFVKLYFEDISRLYQVSKPASNLFFEMCQLIKTDTHSFPNVIFLSAQTKKNIAIKTGIATDEDDPNIYNTSKYLTELVKAKLLKKVDANTFIANPDIVGKVDWKLAHLMYDIKVQITYDMVGRNIVTIIEEQKEASDYRKQQLRLSSDNY